MLSAKFADPSVYKTIRVEMHIDLRVEFYFINLVDSQRKQRASISDLFRLLVVGNANAVFAAMYHMLHQTCRFQSLTLTSTN
jgi:hypothetical protein